MRSRPVDRTLVHRVGLALAIVYFMAGGVFALWFPSDGLDLYVSYVAGRASLAGVSPYERAAYVATWRGLETPLGLASTVDLPFAYPPSWIPVCIGLGLLPWSAALVLWKLLNVALLVGSMLLTVRLLAAESRDEVARSSAWTFALVLSPTISVMTLGQSSLLVVCALLASAWLLQCGRPYLAGLALAVALIKPQLSLPLVVFFLLRGAFVTLVVAAMFTGILTVAGLVLSHSSLGTYVSGVGTYAASNSPTSHIAVGLASLLAYLTDLTTRSATAIGLLAGVLLIGAVAYRHRDDDGATALAAVPILLYLAPLAFRCNGYDLVALIPLFIWSQRTRVPAGLGRAVRGLCWMLVVPRGAIRFAFGVLVPGLVSADAVRLAEQSFRSWILLLLLPPVLAAVWTRPAR